jgi:hypothetical protein
MKVQIVRPSRYSFQQKGKFFQGQTMGFPVGTGAEAAAQIAYVGYFQIHFPEPLGIGFPFHNNLLKLFL